MLDIPLWVKWTISEPETKLLSTSSTIITSVPPIPVTSVTTALTPDPVAPSWFISNKSPGAYPDPPLVMVTAAPAIALLATVTFAVKPEPSPVKDVNPIPVYGPSVNPIPALDIIVNLLFPVFSGPPVLNTLPEWTTPSTVCCISSFCVMTVSVDIPNLTLTLFENATTGLFFLILPRGSSLLKSNRLDGVFVTKSALLSLNLRSSYWLAVQVLLFCDLNSEPRVGWVLFNPWVIKSLSPILLMNAR